MGPDGIKRLRIFFGWSQERLARELGVSFSTVNRWERGRSRPSPMALNALQKLGAGRSGNKRSYPRFNSSFRMEFRVNGGMSSFGSVIENISLGGGMFSTEQALGPGDRVTLGLKPEGSGVLRCGAEVVWVSEDRGKRRVGVRFIPGGQDGVAGIVSSFASENMQH